MDPGDLIAGRYRLQEQVGEGAMGVVWRGLDTELDRVVALKRARVDPPTDDERIRREARIAAGVNHPGVVTLFDIVREGAGRWLVMEYVPASTLTEVLAADGPLPPDEVARIGALLASALAAVHAAGVVHRDIKPGNVLIGVAGVVKLTDFGISRLTWAEQTLTSAAIIGTPAYLAPEVAAGGDPTTSSDVFGLGATLYAAVEGEPPFGTADNPMALLRRAASGNVRAPRRAGGLGDVLGALLAADPAARPTAAQARAALVAVTSGEVTAGVPAVAGDATITAPTQPQAAARAPSRSPLRRPRPVVLGAVLAALLATGVTGMVVAGNDDDPPTAPAAGTAALGNPRTADPCALVHPPSLAAFGSPRLDTAVGNFDRCDVLITTASGATVDVKAQLLGVATAPAVGADRCGRTMPLSAGEGVLIEASRTTRNADLDPCAVVDAAEQVAARVLASGSVPRRGPFAAASLGSARACDLLVARDLARIRGLLGADPAPGFGDWSCRWSAGETSVALSFDRDPPLGDGDGNRRMLAGHPAYVKPVTGSGCRVRLVNRTEQIDGKPRQEIADLRLTGTGSSERLCKEARALAEAVAGRLPSQPDRTKVTNETKGSSGKKKDRGTEDERAAQQAAECAVNAASDPARAAECALRFGR